MKEGAFFYFDTQYFKPTPPSFYTRGVISN